MAKKTYIVVYGPTSWKCQIAIDEDFKVPFINDETKLPEDTKWAIKEMVEFWGWWQERLDRNEGDYTKTFLQQLAREINYIQVEYDYNLRGVIEEFENREGWFKMDGSLGIEILSIDDFEMEYHDYEVMEDPA
ncbi:DUF2528 family protein [Mucilaginibacter sp.]